MKGPCLISGFFDTCRVFASDKSQPEGVPESSRSTELRHLIRVRSSSQLPVEKVMFYATSRGSKADDGKEGSGGECMPRHQCLSAEYVCSPVVAKLSVAYVENVTCLRKHDYGVYPIYKYVRGFHAIPAQIFATTECGIGRGNHECDHGRQCFHKIPAESGS